MEFPKRPRIELTMTARRRIWRSKCGRFRVIESISLYGLPTVWYVMKIDLYDSWSIASRHRKKSAAFKAAEKLGR